MIELALTSLLGVYLIGAALIYSFDTVIMDKPLDEESGQVERKQRQRIALCWPIIAGWCLFVWATMKWHGRKEK